MTPRVRVTGARHPSKPLQRDDGRLPYIITNKHRARSDAFAETLVWKTPFEAAHTHSRSHAYGYALRAATPAEVESYERRGTT